METTVAIHGIMKTTVKNQLLMLISVLGITASPLSVAATVTASVDVQISTNIAVSAATGMTFGDLTAGPSGGAVVMDTDGKRTATGSVELNSASPSSPATFNISGTPNSTYSVLLPDSVTLSDGGANQITVSNFLSNPDASGQLSSSGEQSVSIGGTLSIGANQGFGDYAGSMQVTINYF